jgi:hypothetical protein
VTALGDLGAVELAQGRAELAEPMLRECLTQRLVFLPAGHAQLDEAKERLAECLGKLGRPAESDPLLVETAPAH